MPPKVSVIVPVYNAERYLARCVDSVLSQTLTDFELILVDDESTDNSPALCDAYAAKDKRVRVFHKEKNEGTGLALKTGVFMARAEYILFSDNDDWIELDTLEAFWTKAKEKNYDLVYANAFIEYYGESHYGKWQAKNKNELAFYWSKLIKTEVVQKVDFPALSGYADVVIFKQIIFYIDNYGYVDKGLYHYVFRPDSVTNKTKDGIKRLLEMFIGDTLLILFYAEHEGGLNVDDYVSYSAAHVADFPYYCSYNKKIIDAYRKEIDRIDALRKQGLLTKTSLQSEQEKTVSKIIALDKKNWAKILLDPLRLIRKHLPPILSGKLVYLFDKWMRRIVFR